MDDGVVLRLLRAWMRRTWPGVQIQRRRRCARSGRQKMPAATTHMLIPRPTLRTGRLACNHWSSVSDTLQMRQNANFSRSSIFLSQEVVIGTTRQAACMDYGLTLERLINSSAERAQHRLILAWASLPLCRSLHNELLLLLLLLSVTANTCYNWQFSKLVTSEWSKIVDTYSLRRWSRGKGWWLSRQF